MGRLEAHTVRMKSHTLAGPTFLSRLTGSILGNITGGLVTAPGAVRGASIDEFGSSLLSCIDDASGCQRAILRFFSRSGQIPGQDVR